MQLVAKPIDVIVTCDKLGNMKPLKFKVEEEGLPEVIVVNRVRDRRIEKFGTGKKVTFRCSSIIGNIEKPYELRFDTESCKWLLLKI